MKSTAEIIKQMEKELLGSRKGLIDLPAISPFEVIDRLDFYDEFQSKLRSYTRTLLESFGEEIKLEKQRGEGEASEQPVSFGYVMGYNKAVDDISIKMKEIISSIGK